MTEDRLRELLRADPTAAEREAEERGWAVVKAAHAERSVAAPPRSHRSLALALAGAALLLALALSPAGAQVADWIEDVVQPGEENAAPSLTALPAPGRLLVESERGPWIVQEDGSTRLLADYDTATWSPRGRFLAVTQDRQLIAVVADSAATGQSVGTPRWTVPATGRIRSVAWAPSGVRVAYVHGGNLSIVDGAGENDRVLARDVAPTAPQWRPLSATEQRAVDPTTGVAVGARNTLAYVDERRRVTVVNADSGETLWRTAPFVGGIRALTWSPDGRSLLALGPSFYTVYRADGRAVSKGGAVEAGGTFVGASFAPEGDWIALVSRGVPSAHGRKSVVSLVPADGAQGKPHRLYAGSAGFAEPTWSPDGRWLLVPWPAADQWLFLEPGQPGKPEAVDGISRQFDPGGLGPSAFPRISGWCCAP